MLFGINKKFLMLAFFSFNFFYEWHRITKGGFFLTLFFVQLLITLNQEILPNSCFGSGDKFF